MFKILVHYTPTVQESDPGTVAGKNLLLVPVSQGGKEPHIAFQQLAT